MRVLAKPVETVKLNAILEKWIPKSKQKKYTSSGCKSSPSEISNINIEGLNTADMSTA